MFLNQKLKEKNIFSLLQYIGAILVIASHAYPISMGDNYVNPLYRITNGQLSFGEIAVNLFFFVSGLFIVNSVKKSSGFRKYFIDRCKRIFPPLIIVMFISTYVFGFFFTTVNKMDYLTSLSTFKFFVLNSLMIPHHYLPGVFENTVYSGALNGSLWTLAPQFLCYILCYFAYKLKLLDKGKMIFTFPMVLLVWFNIEKVYAISPLIYNMMHPMIFFYMGCLFNVYSEFIILKWNYTIVAIIASLIFLKVDLYKYVSIITYPYILLFVAYSWNVKKIYIDFCKKYFYLYFLWGFFVQRMIAYLFGGSMNVYLNIVLSVFVTHFLSVLCVKLIK